MTQLKVLDFGGTMPRGIIFPLTRGTLACSPFEQSDICINEQHHNALKQNNTPIQ